MCNYHGKCMHKQVAQALHVSRSMLSMLFSATAEYPLLCLDCVCITGRDMAFDSIVAVKFTFAHRSEIVF